MDASFLTPLGKDFSLFKALPEETYPMRVAELKGYYIIVINERR